MKRATAICGAYLLVGFADAKLSSVEEARFLGGLVNDPALARTSAEEIGSEYNRLRRALAENYSAAEAEIVAAAASLRDDAQAVHAVKLAARCAIVADRALKPQEELALSLIADALGLAKGEL